MIPAALVKQYLYHDNFKDEFRSWLDKFSHDGNKVVGEESPQPQADPAGGSPSSKRKNGLKHMEESVKKLKTDPALIISMQEVTQALLVEAAIKGETLMNLRANNTKYIVNKSTSKETAISVHEHVAGFGKGGFKLIKDNAATLEDNSVEFKLLGPDSTIQVNGVTTTLGNVLRCQRESDPDCKVNYHKITWDSKDLQKFAIEQTHRVAFCCSDSAAQTTCANIAAKEKHEGWNNHITKLIWVCKWTRKGLMPAKPVVVLRGELTLPAEHCVMLAPIASDASV